MLHLCMLHKPQHHVSHAILWHLGNPLHSLLSKMLSLQTGPPLVPCSGHLHMTRHAWYIMFPLHATLLQAAALEGSSHDC